MKTVVFIVGFFFTPIVLWTSTRNCEVWYSIRNEIIHQIVNQKGTLLLWSCC